MSVVSENVGAPEPPERCGLCGRPTESDGFCRYCEKPLLDNGLRRPVVLRYVPDDPSELDARCRFCRRPLVANEFVIAVKGNYCLDCHRAALKATGCGVAGLGKARTTNGPC